MWKGHEPFSSVISHRPRRARTESGALVYLAQWQRRVELVERRVRHGPQSGRGGQPTIPREPTGCPACDFAFYGDEPRNRLERLMHRNGRRAHRLRAAVTRLDERYRDATIEVEAPANLSWWDRRVPWR
jgi:hypothetical protein